LWFRMKYLDMEPLIALCNVLGLRV